MLVSFICLFIPPDQTCPEISIIIISLSSISGVRSHPALSKLFLSFQPSHSKLTHSQLSHSHHYSQSVLHQIVKLKICTLPCFVEIFTCDLICLLR